ncbi:glutamate racemase [Psychrobacillus psychrodurans]|uniref:glutamate racemase n=1 Tax=Psychrobacillus psychrodurans TaxID=126157 RepID=UPI0008F2190C|nr:glutamate racemase [Psychrobacillus psychrodurans]SFN00131.1 glutamate racemase [Psychrobacillus psychrodurans]
MNAPIGVIDSGVGGLTVAKEIMQLLPNEKIIYIGDTARCPYGPRTSEEVRKFTWQLANVLAKMNIKMLVIACNTATAVALNSLSNKMPFPVIGVIFPGARAAIKATKSNEIVVLGTSGTIKSGAYEKAIASLNTSSKVIPLACPTFVPLVESNEYEGEFARNMVMEKLAPLKREQFDTVILGCTHYPLLQKHIEEAVGNHVKVLSSAEETAHDVKEYLNYHELNNPIKHKETPIFFTTGSVPIFKTIVEKWLEIPSADVRTISFK